MRTVTAVNLNIIDLYKLLAEKPDEIASMLKNFYGYEILRLKKAIQEATDFIHEEHGLDGSRDGFIEDQLKDLADKFDEATLVMQFFRYVNLTSKPDEVEFTSDALMDSLMSIKALVIAETEHFSENVRHERLELLKAESAYCVSRFEKGTEGEILFLDWKKTALKKLENVAELVEAIDEKLSK